MFKKILKILFVIFSCIWYVVCLKCDRRPFNTIMQNTPANGNFEITLGDKRSGSYLPDEQYTVSLRLVNSLMETPPTFTAFMISVTAEMEIDPKNPRRQKLRDAGLLSPMNELATFSTKCPNSVVHTNLQKKTHIEVYWHSPARGNGCVTFHAMVAENEEVWYMDDGPLSLRVCEDTRQEADIEPMQIENCVACMDAKYELRFEGLWSRNIHPSGYPSNEWSTKYSDLIGASHSIDYSFWSPSTIASPGMKALAETGKTQYLEEEIQNNFDKIRTLIKGKGHGFPYKNEPTYAIFRVDKNHHLITIAISIIPSPDWFLGVSRLELCTSSGSWTQNRTINLYPYDAGTDNGAAYESPNDVTTPQEYIKRIRPGTVPDNSPFANMSTENLKPFARLYITLVRTYDRNCNAETEESNPTDEGGEEQTDPEPPKRITSPEPPNEEEPRIPGSDDEESDDNCRITPWDEWSACIGSCNRGVQHRRRYHIYNNAIVKYSPKDPEKKLGVVPRECEEKYSGKLLEIRQCPGECDTEKAQRRIGGLSKREKPMEQIQHVNDDVRDCIMSKWAWSQCQGDCNMALRYGKRKILEHPRYGGQECPKLLTKYSTCIPEYC